MHAQVWVISHAEKQAELSSKQIRSIFSLREKNWPDGQVIELVVMKDNSELHKQFCLDALKLFPYQLSRIWERQIYTGTAIAPTIVDSEQEMLDTIIKNPNAIGYVSQEVSNEDLHSIIVD
ncbi:substrate-binding domain-containing protein [Agarivorans sp. 1_MG-2023]|uniref:substrate-binding domain-containing protein n=1 Tax=Agarivorans sp. 1_MG-2023 TaxID=3062634 RepID=UPI0026E45005|nr:substrate-binding domain-containing protein [Agarivorans sp. 1_MG-2023]MDO6764024.1 substrate-binding domain-containing protein [Agarivorans sp. 1_MG-2023]